MMARRDGTYLVVAAIDFGTTYSGYAYSFRDDFVKDPLKILTNAQWIDDETNLVTFKAPTSVLFDKDRKFSSFGFSAETNYNRLVDDEEDEDWRFFRRFKMSLYREMKEANEAAELARHRRRLGRSLKLKDAHGNSMAAMDIFSDAIRYLKDHFLTTLNNSVKGTSEDDVHWILTVPAIWSDAAKQFMREAAEQAGILKHQLTLALEPEAAAIYCKEIAVKTSKEHGSSKDLSAFTPGEQFLLLDIGVDITCHEVINDGTLKEKHPPTGGPWGGTVVDEAYFGFLQDLVGQEAWKDFTKNNPADKLELERMFEMKKRNLKKNDDTIIRVGMNFLQSYNNVCKCTLAKTLSEKKTIYSTTVEVKKEKLKIQNSQIMEFFEGPMNAIVEHLERLFARKSLVRVNTILMVGGFSELDQMKEKIESSFPGKDVIRPVEANLAVLKGAVMFGHSPQAICERASPRTYGISTSVPYNDRIHPKKLYFVSDGNDMATDIFQVMVRAGQPVIMGKTKVEHICHPAHGYDTEATVEVYESTAESPAYTCDSSCRRLGELRVQIPDTSRGKARRIVVALHFGFTELKVTATEEGTNHKAEAKFDCLSTKS
ncbi:heat shock 70 kDa protein 12B-like isoform X2 [Mizuhopecten yessoensis]|uniref:heat shock 70 kDa protein 12B-like isoform X2 n=1 Tax=Mizuhopecten yessoensis TaxID=6573 RepID=UPI000B45971F|nr:heat shock 70 kDa protein 12B-like isoform X2 [Mizuhopecten yessoensis]